MAWKPWRLPHVVAWIELSASEPGTTLNQNVLYRKSSVEYSHRSRSVLDPGSDLASINFEMVAIDLHLNRCAAYHKLARGNKIVSRRLASIVGAVRFRLLGD